METIFIICSIVFIYSTLSTLSKSEKWWIRAFDFPFVQFTIFGLGSLFLLIYVSHPSWIAIVIGIVQAILIIYRIWVIYPYTPLEKPALPKSEKRSGDLRLLTANVLMTNTCYHGLIEVENQVNPDILFLVEVDEKWQNGIHDYLNRQYPHQVLHPLDNTYGMMFYSKLPLRNTSIQFLVEDDVPSIHCEVQLKNGDWVKFYGLHPKPPAPGQNKLSTPRDAELVIVGRLAKNSELPVVVAGDMNDVAWSHTTRLFLRISGLLDPRMGRGFFNTFHAENPLLRWPLDHVFLSHHFRVVRMKRLDNFRSDHFPIMIEVTVNPSTQAIVSKEHADKSDKKEAQAKIKKVDSDINLN